MYFVIFVLSLFFEKYQNNFEPFENLQFGVAGMFTFGYSYQYCDDIIHEINVYLSF